MTEKNVEVPTLGNSIAGHLTTGAAKGVLALLLAWICTLVLHIDSSFSTLVAALVLAFIISEIVAAIIERPLVLRKRRSHPGGITFVLLPFTASLMISFVLAFALTGSMRDSALVTAVVAFCNLAEILWLKTWEPGPTPEAESATFDEFKAMTKDHFSDDVEEIKRRAREKTREKYYKKKARDEAKKKNRK